VRTLHRSAGWNIFFKAKQRRKFAGYIQSTFSFFKCKTKNREELPICLRFWQKMQVKIRGF
jgi:hypothetical protein